ncbi:MAG TPA: phosphatase PAP2 family protein [Candidatus Dormibacteraeota bacterium]|jgi:undecaprenyl-diphosphatase|nr:phosphatase PAP2 family protein [Candidatus Dormibacteraeota bacterium]
MTSLDLRIFYFLNSFAHRSAIADFLIVRTAENPLTTGAVIVALFWVAWEVEGKEDMEKRETLLLGLLASMFSVFLARAIALALPFRVRPMHNTEIGYRLPYEMNPDILIRWSSFPSDHATLFLCLAAVLWMVSRRLGTIAILYVLIVIDLPRIYAGMHYPSDIVAGSLLGICVALLARLPWLRRAVAKPALDYKESHPVMFHFCFFLCAFEVGDLFSTVRDFGRYAVHALHLGSHFTR